MSPEAWWEWGRWKGSPRGLLSVQFSSRLLHILCASDSQSFLKCTQLQLLSLHIPALISISLSCLIETVLQFPMNILRHKVYPLTPHTDSTMQLLNSGSTKASCFRFHSEETRQIPSGQTLIHLGLEDSLFQWSSSF